MSRFLSSKYRSLVEYVPGEQPRDKKYIKLNTNESPFPPSDGVIRAISKNEIADLRLYSDPECKALKAKLADVYGVKPENLYVANGSDDILNFAFTAFGDNGVVYPAISYGFYRVFADLYQMEAEEIPLQSDFSIDAEQYFGRHQLVENALAPFKVTDTAGQFDVIALCDGGGISGQSGALRLGIARALLNAGDYRADLTKAGFLTRDARVVERKKYGLKKARRAPQFSKR